MVVDEPHVFLHVVGQHIVSLARGITHKTILVVHVMMFAHHAFQFGDERPHDMAEQLVLALEVIIDIAHTYPHPLGNVAHGGLGVSVFQKHPLGKLNNLLACIVFFYLHRFSLQIASQRYGK